MSLYIKIYPQTQLKTVAATYYLSQLKLAERSWEVLFYLLLSGAAGIWET